MIENIVKDGIIKNQKIIIGNKKYVVALSFISEGFKYAFYVEDANLLEDENAIVYFYLDRVFEKDGKLSFEEISKEDCYKILEKRIITIGTNCVNDSKSNLEFIDSMAGKGFKLSPLSEQEVILPKEEYSQSIDVKHLNIIKRVYTDFINREKSIEENIAIKNEIKEKKEQVTQKMTQVINKLSDFFEAKNEESINQIKELYNKKIEESKKDYEEALSKVYSTKKDLEELNKQLEAKIEEQKLEYEGKLESQKVELQDKFSSEKANYERSIEEDKTKISEYIKKIVSELERVKNENEILKNNKEQKENKDYEILKNENEILKNQTRTALDTQNDLIRQLNEIKEKYKSLEEENALLKSSKVETLKEIR